MKRSALVTPLLTLFAVLSAAALLAACGKKTEGAAAATQVAVKVGSEEISVHQINQVLSRANTAGATPQALQAMSREVLERLIDEQLEVDQASENKLNRAPEVVAAIEAAKREVLARAYLQQLVSTLPKPTPEETRKYYADHPVLFAERRVYNVQELIVPAPADPAVEELFKAYAANGKPLEELAAALKAKDIKFQGGSAARAAEQVPLDLLDRLAALKDGQSLLTQTPQALTLVHLASSQAQPVTEEAALPRIAQFLSNQRANEAIADNLKKLRAATRIEYQGEFAKPLAAAAPAAPAEPAAADPGKALLEKGVSGLK
jgi:EpsD family peptidyl-prolyl cis-trans isomerase